MSRVLLEPPGPQLLAGRTGTDRLRLAAGAAALVLALTSSGDVLVVAVLLGAVAGDALAFAAVLLAAMAVLARWGTGSLAAIAGGQAVLGAAGVYGTAAAVGSSWYAALTVALASPGGWLSVPFGAVAGLLVAGPGLTGATNGLVRVAGTIVGVVVAAAAPRFLPARLAVRVGVALGGLALLLAAAR